MQTKKVKQKNLTSDCWLVQFQGLESCASCDHFKKPSCGGGETLASIIINHNRISLSKMEKHETAEFFTNPSTPGETFKDLLDYLNNSDILGIPRLEKQYTKMVNQHKARLSEETGKIRLDEKYPYSEIRNQGKTIYKNGYHKVNRPYFSCDCDPITKSNGAYRDHIIDLENGTRLYYLHQHCIIARLENKYILDSCKYRTKTTKNRLNSWLPRSQGKIFSEGEKWFVSYPKPKKANMGAIDYKRFFDGITIKRYKKYDKKGVYYI